MSYDVTLTGWGVSGTSHNITFNVRPMLVAAGADLNNFHDKKAGRLLSVLDAAIKDMEDRPAVYQEMNPPNGWGDYESCLGFLRDLLKDFAEHPRATVVVYK
jgi:hypothetical protein